MHISLSTGGGVGDGSIEVGVGVETGPYLWNKMTTSPWVPPGAPGAPGEAPTPRVLDLSAVATTKKGGGGTPSLLMLQMLPPVRWLC